jgi:hypothetical protein
MDRETLYSRYTSQNNSTDDLEKGKTIYEKEEEGNKNLTRYGLGIQPQKNFI